MTVGNGMKKEKIISDISIYSNSNNSSKTLRRTIIKGSSPCEVTASSGCV